MKHRKTFILVALFAVILTATGFQTSPEYKILFEKAKFTMETKGDLNGAIVLFNDIIKKYPKEREYAAKSQLYIGLCYEKLGVNESQKAYQRVVDTYPEQTEMVAQAKAKLTRLNSFTSESTLKAEQSFKLASELFKQLKYEAAVIEYEKIIKLVPKSQMAQEAQLWIGHCYFKQGKNEQALKSFNSIVKEYPGSTIIPVTELMISQVKQAIGSGSPNRKAIVLDDKTILDTVTGIKFTKINSWAGKNDVIVSTSYITDIIPNRKFLLSGNKVIPFENSEPFTLNDSLNSFSKLSPDGTKLAFLGKNSISLIPVSPINGRPTGPAQKILDIQYQYGYGINWSPDGNNLIFSLMMESKLSIWTYSTVDHSLKQITNASTYPVSNAVYSKNGLNFLCRQGSNIMMKSLEGKSVSILDSCKYQQKSFILSPDNKYIMYTKMNNKKMLYRMSDKQEMELSTPLEVGDFISWTDKENKAFSFCPSSVYNDAVKVASVFGGPVFELEKLKGGGIVGWAPNSGSVLVCKGKLGKQSLLKVNLNNQDTISLNGIDNLSGYPLLSPDGTKVLALLNSQGKKNLSVVPISLKDGKITGKPILIINNFAGYPLANCSWSPDGKSFAVCNQGDVYIYSADGSTPTQLTKTSVIENYPNWSPDGNAISVFIRSTNQLRILKATDGEVLMTQEKADNYTWTPDGKEILIAFEDGQLNAVSIISGKSRKIANWKEMFQSEGLNDLIYSPDGKKIIIDGYQNAPTYKTCTFLFNVADGKISEVATNYDENIESFTWSPDSKWISYVSYGKKRDRLESTLWEADLTGFMKKIRPGTEKGFTTDFDFKALALPAGGVPPDGTFTDSRDGHVYKYKKIGTQTWMTENLAYLPEVSPDSSYSVVDKRFYVYGYTGSDVTAAKKSENYKKYGILYNWPAAMNGAASSNSVPSSVQGVCPKGWHLPSDAEWLILEKELGMNEADLLRESPAVRPSGSVDKKLKSPVGWDDDDIFIGQSGFNALPGGVFKSMKRSAYFWTSTSSSYEMDIRKKDRKIARIISEGSSLRSPWFTKNSALYIRCVKD